MKKKEQLQKIIKQLIRRSFVDGKIIESQVVKSIRILKSLSPKDAIFALSEFLNEIKRQQREHTMYLETATPLSTSQLIKMKKIVQRRSLPAGRQVKITKIITNVNSEILGGFKLKIGDEVWDESIAGKIKQLKEVIGG